jgi:calcium-dependent protein kinase
VYLVKQKETNIEFAVKAFSKNNVEASSSGRACLVNEITIMRRIDSHYLVSLKYVYETHNSLYLVLELLSGGEIFKIDDGKLNTQHSKFILYNLLKGIRDLRKFNIIHRDLKPDNIIFKYKDRNVMDNELKIVDFGLSSFTHPTTFLVHRKCGTPGFIAPEVIHMQRDQTADMCGNCDIFSVGMIFFFMLTGIIPYDGDDIYQIMHNNKQGTINFKIP